MNYLTLDIIFIAFLVIMAIFGYMRGFITRLYDFISFIFVLYISFYFSKPLSHMVNIYPEVADNQAIQMTTELLNQVIVFIGLLIALFIVNKIIGLLIKPLLKGIVHKFSLTKFVDKTLGMILGLVEGLIISYIAIVCMMTPLSPSTNQLVKKSQVASLYISLVPYIGDNVVNITEGLEELEINHNSNESVMKVMLAAYDMGLIDNTQVDSLIQNYLESELQKNNISLTDKEYNQFKDIMENIDYNSDEIKKILSNINVSDE